MFSANFVFISLPENIFVADFVVFWNWFQFEAGTDSI